MFVDGINTKRNELCPCKSGKKFKNCCIEKYSIVKEMYENLKINKQSNYRISDILIVESGIPLIEDDYSDIIKFAKEKIENK